MRTAAITRTTRETDITLTLTLDGSGKTSLSTGIGFFDHMLDALCRFGQLDLALTCRGDLHVDAHHTVEDVGICLGRAIRDALGDRAASAAPRVPICRWTKPLRLPRWTSAAARIWFSTRNLPPPCAGSSTRSWRRNSSVRSP